MLLRPFLFSIPERLKRNAENLDAKAILCGRSWQVFNDEGVKQVFIFQEDGSLLISTDGYVTSSTWQYIAVNHSVVITSNGKSLMLHPEYVDTVILALSQDGSTEKYCFIDEKNVSVFPNRTIMELESYLGKANSLAEAKETKKIAPKTVAPTTVYTKNENVEPANEPHKVTIQKQHLPSDAELEKRWIDHKFRSFLERHPEAVRRNERLKHLIDQCDAAETKSHLYGTLSAVSCMAFGLLTLIDSIAVVTGILCVCCFLIGICCFVFIKGPDVSKESRECRDFFFALIDEDYNKGIIDEKTKKMLSSKMWSSLPY